MTGFEAPRKRRRWLIIVLMAFCCCCALATYLVLRPQGPPLPSLLPARPNQSRPNQWRRSAQVRVATTPAGATIIVDGIANGLLSPDFFSIDVSAAHIMRLELEGHEPVEMELRLRPGEVHELWIPLQRIQE